MDQVSNAICIMAEEALPRYAVKRIATTHDAGRWGDHGDVLFSDGKRWRSLILPLGNFILNTGEALNPWDYAALLRQQGEECWVQGSEPVHFYS